ncbi:hypothetical protein [Novosphingobium sp.]
MRTSIEILVAILTSILAGGVVIAVLIATAALLAVGALWWLIGKRPH